MIGVFLFVRRHPLPLLAVADLLAPAMLLGLAIGRVGCLLNGCCFGAVCDRPWALEFPAGTPPDFTPAYHTQLDRGQLYGFKLSDNPDTAPCVVLAVDADSPAARAGLKAGDRLLGINAAESPRPAMRTRPSRTLSSITTRSTFR